MKGYGCAHKIPKSDGRHRRWAKQRRTRGFDETELWNLDTTFVRFLLPRLKAFRAGTGGKVHSGSLTDQEWTGILDKMIAGFEKHIDDDAEKDDIEVVQRAFDLLAKYWHGLWY